MLSVCGVHKASVFLIMGQVQLHIYLIYTTLLSDMRHRRTTPAEGSKVAALVVRLYKVFQKRLQPAFWLLAVSDSFQNIPRSWSCHPAISTKNLKGGSTRDRYSYDKHCTCGQPICNGNLLVHTRKHRSHSITTWQDVAFIASRLAWNGPLGVTDGVWSDSTTTGTSSSLSRGLCHKLHIQDDLHTVHESPSRSGGTSLPLPALRVSLGCYRYPGMQSTVGKTASFWTEDSDMFTCTHTHTHTTLQTLLELQVNPVICL